SRRHRSAHQRRALPAHRGSADAAAVVSARRVAADRHQVRRRAWRERRGSDPAGRQAGFRDHAPDEFAGRQVGDHGGGPGRQRRHPASAAAGLHRRGRDRLRLPDPGASRDQARRRQQGGPAMNGDKTRHAIRLDRRRFLQVLAGTAGALVVGIRVADAAGAPLPPALLGENFHDLGAYVRIDGDGNVLIGARDPDTGTGVATSLPRIIAEELDADWNRVSVVALGLGVGNSNGQPRWTYGRQVGGSGGSIPAAWNDLRQVGALARWLLMQAAARRLGVSANRLRCDSGTVIAPDGRRVTYGSLAA